MSRNRNLSKALKTDISGLLPMVADALKKHGRGKDTMLAHITPGEARLLKARGGSGTINPKTGLPEFDNPEMGAYEMPVDTFVTNPNASQEYYANTSYVDPQVKSVQGNVYVDDTGVTSNSQNWQTVNVPNYLGASVGQYGFYNEPGTSQNAQNLQNLNLPFAQAAPTQEQAPPTPPSVPMTGADVQSAAAASDQGNLGTPQQQQQQQQQAAKQGFFDKAGDQLLKGISDPATLAKLGLGLGSGALGYSMQQKAIAQAKNAAAQIKQAQQTAAAQERALAQPIANQAASVMSQTVQGQLTPASLQAFQAMQAQEAQRMASAGGVGAQQMEANHARAIQTLLDGQQKTYLSLFAASNPMMTDAINKDLAGTTQGLTTSLDLQAKANQASAQLYGSIMSALAGSMKSGQ